MGMPGDTPTDTPTDQTAAALSRPPALAGMLSPVTEAEHSRAKYLQVTRQGPRFIFRFKPGEGSWEVAWKGDEPVLLPSLNAHFLSVGVNGTRTIKRGENPRQAYSMAVRARQDKGWIYLDKEATSLPAELLPAPVLALAKAAGLGEVGYLMRYNALLLPHGDQIVHYADAWDLPDLSAYQLPNQPTPINRDRAGFDAFRLHLVTSGRIQLPHPGELREKIANLARNLSLSESAQFGTEEGRARSINRARDKVEAFKFALEHLQKLKQQATAA